MQVMKSKRIRPGKGKHRNRRYKMKLGPLVIYDQDNGIVAAFRNIPGVELAQVKLLSDGQTDRHADKQTDQQTDKQTDQQTSRQTDRQR